MCRLRLGQMKAACQTHTSRASARAGGSALRFESCETQTPSPSAHQKIPFFSPDFSIPFCSGKNGAHSTSGYVTLACSLRSGSCASEPSMCLMQRARAAAPPPKARTRPSLSAAATLPHQKPPTLSLDRLFLVVRLTVAVGGGVSASVALSLNHHQSIIIAASKRKPKNKQVFAHHHPHVCVLRGASPSEAPGNIYCLCVCVRVGSSWRFVCVRVCSGCSVGTLVGARLKIINVCVFIYIYVRVLRVCTRCCFYVLPKTKANYQMPSGGSVCVPNVQCLLLHL